MDTYYQLVDRDTSTVSSLWKGIHLTSLIMVIASDFITATTFGKALEFFGNNCILYANISFQENNDTYFNNATSGSFIRQERPRLPSYLMPINIIDTSWGSHGECDFCQFTPVVSMISALIWCAFFLMYSKGGAGYITDVLYTPWRLVYPALLFTTASTSVSLVSTLHMSRGIYAFCAEFGTVFHTKQCIDEINKYTLMFNSFPRDFIIRLKLAIIFGYIGFSGWLIQLITLVLRILCITDFQMIRITVTSHNDPETVLEIIEPIPDYDQTSMFTIPEEKILSSSQDSTPQPEHTKKKSSTKPRRYQHTSSDLDQELTTDSTYIMSSPDLSERSDFPMLPFDKAADPRRVSFGPPVQVGTAFPNNGTKDINKENISLSVLNKEPVGLNQDITSDSTKKATLYTPNSVFDM